MRENTILPIGAHKEGPVYDYTDGVTLRLYNVTNAERMICNSKGEKVLTVKAIREGDTLTVTLDGAYKMQRSCWSTLRPKQKMPSRLQRVR